MRCLPSPDGRRVGGEGRAVDKRDGTLTTTQRQFVRTLRRQATSAEDVLWQALRGRRLSGLKFRRQVPLLTSTVDFACIERRLVVELDGRQHEWQAEYDGKRTQEIGSQGFEIVRFANRDVLDDLDAVLATIDVPAPGREPLGRVPSPLAPLPPGRGEHGAP